MKEGDRVDLGEGRSFSALHLPGHTSGSLGLVDEKEGILATGDVLYQTEGELIDWYVV